MVAESAAVGAVDGDAGEEGDGCREEGVGLEDLEVEDARRSGAGEVLGADVGVVDQVAGEEGGRGDERRDHDVAVGLPALGADQEIASDQEERRESVESGVDRGELLDGGHGRGDSTPRHAPAGESRGGRRGSGDGRRQSGLEFACLIRV
jgi:hypothetical protein